MNQQPEDKPKRWVQAPSPTCLMPQAPAVLGVYLSEGEDVEWCWTHTNSGSYASGYTLIDKKASR
jgi:hypothetical protein